MRFVIWGDSKGKENGINKNVLNSIMNEISKLNPKPKFMVMLGDTVAGSLDEEVFIKQLFDLNDIIYKYTPQITLLPVIGNHEVNITPTDDRFEKVLANYYSKFSPQNFLQSYNKTVYYQDFDDARIIVLNSFHPNQTHKINSSQLNFLKEASLNYNKFKFVFVHSPAFPTGAHLGHCLDLYKDERDEFWNTVKECNIDIVFSGHEHNYSRRVIKDMCQIITGGAGEKLRNKYKSHDGVIVSPIAVYHFLVVDVNSTNYKIQAITNKGKIIDEFIK